MKAWCTKTRSLSVVVVPAPSFTKINENIWWIFPNCSVPLTSMDTVVKKCFCRKITVRKTNKISVFGIESVHTLLL
jgi:hypothetical protein